MRGERGQLKEYIFMLKEELRMQTSRLEESNRLLAEANSKLQAQQAISQQVGRPARCTRLALTLSVRQWIPVCCPVFFCFVTWANAGQLEQEIKAQRDRIRKLEAQQSIASALKRELNVARAEMEVAIKLTDCCG